MNKLVALSLAIGGVGGIMTWIYTSTPLALSIPISFNSSGNTLQSYQFGYVTQLLNGILQKPKSPNEYPHSNSLS